MLFLVFMPASILQNMSVNVASSDNPKIDTQCLYSSVNGGLVYIDCSPGYYSEHDRIILFDQNKEIKFNLGDEVGLIDIKKGALLFDVSADSSVNLVVEFSLDQNGAAIAKLYDDRSGDGIVSVIHLVDGIVINEPGPALIVSAKDGWWYKNEIANFNLDIFVDGSMLAFFGPLSYAEQFKIDNEYDVVLHVRDTNYDGRPDLEWRQIFLGFSEFDGYNRTQVIVNTKYNEKSIEGAVVWPYIGDAIKNNFVFSKPSYFYSPPPIDVDWSTGRITHLNEFVGSRTNAGNYFIYSQYRLNENEVSISNFESPFAYYDLSGGTDQFPNLLIRSVYYPENDKFIQSLFSSSNGNPINGFLYVWRFPKQIETNVPVWDYKISLMGSYSTNTVLEVGDLKIHTFDPENLPNWVLDSPWEFAIFVANQESKDPNSEGILTWGTTLEQISPETFRYLAGEIDDFSLDYFNDIDVGYRGDVAPRLRDKLYLYYSPIDRLLHLYNSKFGVWRVGESEVIRFSDIDEDGYIDHWVHILDNRPIEELWCLSGDVVYYDHLSQSGEWKKSVCGGDIFQPPNDNKSWEQLRSLEYNSIKVDSLDLWQIVDELPGETWELVNISLSDIHHTEFGYRFVIELLPNFSIPEDLIDTSPLTPGRYFGVLSGGKLNLSLLIPAKIELQIQTRDDGNLPLALQIVALNQGGEGVKGLELGLTVDCGNGLQELERQEIDLLAGEFKELNVQWSPPAGKDCSIMAQVLHDSGEVLAAQEFRFESGESSWGQQTRIIEISSESWRRWPAGLVLILVSGLSGMLGLFYLNRRGGCERPHRDKS